MARACGKAILLGEHAVVHGVPALVAGLDRGVEAHALPAEGPRSTLQINDGEPVGSDSDSDLGRALRALLDACGLDRPVALSARSSLPAGAGVGSSAALGVAAARALAEAFSLPGSADLDQQRALSWERVFHGNPSGIDAAAAALGACFRFTRAAGPEPIQAARDLPLVIGSSGTTASTREMVEGLAHLRDRKREMVDRSITAIGALVDNARLAIEAGDLVGVGKLMDLNQMLLAGLMLSTERLEELCALARGAGALGAKLTGKGGGGAVIALCADEETSAEVLLAFRSRGYEGFTTKVRTATS